MLYQFFIIIIIQLDISVNLKKIDDHFEFLKPFFKMYLKGTEKFYLQTDPEKYVNCFLMHFPSCAFWQNRHEFTKWFGCIISLIFSEKMF